MKENQDNTITSNDEYKKPLLDAIIISTSINKRIPVNKITNGLEFKSVCWALLREHLEKTYKAKLLPYPSKKSIASIDNLKPESYRAKLHTALHFWCLDYPDAALRKLFQATKAKLTIHIRPEGLMLVFDDTKEARAMERARLKKMLLTKLKLKGMLQDAPAEYEDILPEEAQDLAIDKQETEVLIHSWIEDTLSKDSLLVKLTTSNDLPHELLTELGLRHEFNDTKLLLEIFKD